MQLASFTGTRDGVSGLFNRATRLRLRGPYSHSEIVFQPGDGVDDLMPDGTCEPDADGALWCCSSTATELIPEWSLRRAGRRGGVRLKRVALAQAQWEMVDTFASPRLAAQWARENEGRPYDLQLVVGFVSWLVPHKESRVTCSEACAEMLGLTDAWRFDPCTLHAAVRGQLELWREYERRFALCGHHCGGFAGAGAGGH